MVGVSVILCCYNSVKRLPDTLKYLANQNVDKLLQWEIVLVDNNSTDGTSDVAKSLWMSFESPTQLMVINESNPGLSYARKAGMNAARFGIFLFCDDDNWLDRDYVSIVFNQFNKIPKLAALGGWCDAVFNDCQEPPWFNTFKGNFAVGKPKEASGFLNLPNDYLYGAGLALSREAMNEMHSAGFKNILSDRKGKQLSSGGDVEIIYALRFMRFPVYFDEQLHFYHFMPKERMTWTYLLRLRESMYWSNFVLGIYVDAIKQKSYNCITIIKKVIAEVRHISKLRGKIKEKDKFDALFILNQIEVRKMFLKNIFFYVSIRKRLNNLINE